MTSRTDKITETSKKKEVYSDFFCNFVSHPNTQDLVKYTNEESVKRSIKNLFLTNKYERLFQPEIGSNINKILFEPMGDTSASLLKRYCEETINNYEKRAKLIKVEIEQNERNQSYIVNIYFYIINKIDPVGVSITLFRVR